MAAIPSATARKNSLKSTWRSGPACDTKHAKVSYMRYAAQGKKSAGKQGHDAGGLERIGCPEIGP